MRICLVGTSRNLLFVLSCIDDMMPSWPWKECVLLMLNSDPIVHLSM